MKPRIVTQPLAEPVSIQQCHLHLREADYVEPEVGEPEDPVDTQIMALQSAAREWCEAWTGQAIAVKSYQLAFNSFPATISLPLGAFVEVQTIGYVPVRDPEFDQSGQPLPVDLSPVDLDLETIVVDDYDHPVRVLPTTTWPAAVTGTNHVKVTWRAGYAVPGDDDGGVAPLPPTLRAAVLLVLAHLYENREASAERALTEIPLGVEALLRPHRLLLGMA